ncbi:MAG: hypothetical protein OEN56_03820 [Gemmatimonadota bacterium]|nr:hypothetical protein [Gemmatimonadota bacterium]
MYRPPRQRDRSGLLDLDSLMDILSCLVGVMLFLVIYTVLELGSAAYEAPIPVNRGALPGTEAVIVIAESGTVRPLDARQPLNQLLSGFSIVGSDDVPVFVAQANARPTSDRYFEYSLSYDDRFAVFGDPLRTLALVVDMRDGAVGDSLHQLNRSSRFAALLADLDPDDHWISFEVDSSGVSEFRRARDMALDDGFTVLWSPKTIEFPFTHTLAGGSPTDLLRSKTSALVKPER